VGTDEPSVLHRLDLSGSEFDAVIRFVRSRMSRVNASRS
jgi:hypothetical protein